LAASALRPTHCLRLEQQLSLSSVAAAVKHLVDGGRTKILYMLNADAGTICRLADG
jgi:hypothetical protein